MTCLALACSDDGQGPTQLVIEEEDDDDKSHPAIMHYLSLSWDLQQQIRQVQSSLLITVATEEKRH